MQLLQAHIFETLEMLAHANKQKHMSQVSGFHRFLHAMTFRGVALPRANEPDSPAWLAELARGHGDHEGKLWAGRGAPSRALCGCCCPRGRQQEGGHPLCLPREQGLQRGGSQEAPETGSNTHICLKAKRGRSLRAPVWL